MLVSDVLSEAYRKLGRPGQTDMPYEDLIKIVRDVWRGLTLDLKFAAKGHQAIQGNWVTPTSREMSSASFTGGGYIIPLSAEWRPSGSDPDYLPNSAEIIAYEQINNIGYGTDKSIVAFYDGFGQIVFGDLEGVLFEREYRITYESLSDVDLDQTTDLIQTPDLFVSYLSDEAAVRALDYVDGNEVWAEKRERLRGILTAQIMEGRQRFEKWKKTQFGNKKSTKKGVYKNSVYRNW